MAADAKQDKLAALQAELDRVRAEYQEFIYIVSHDLNAPPRKMLAFATRLQTQAGDGLDEKARHYLDRIVANAHILQAQMDALLRVSRCRPTADCTQIEAFQLDAVLQQLADELESAFAAAGGTLSVEAGLPGMQGNRKQVLDLFRELLLNSLQFASPERAPAVRVFDAGSDEQYCRIAVQDNGIGFDGRYNKVIFQIFQRLHGAEDEGAQTGIGAGLSVVHKVAETHGGHVRAQGTPGQGALFQVEMCRHYPHVIDGQELPAS